jgi:hypothetical protein
LTTVARSIIRLRTIPAFGHVLKEDLRLGNGVLEAGAAVGFPYRERPGYGLSGPNFGVLSRLADLGNVNG